MKHILYGIFLLLLVITARIEPNPSFVNLLILVTALLLAIIGLFSKENHKS